MLEWIAKDACKNKVVWITGAASGIGQACAMLFARANANLGLLDIDEVGLQKTRLACAKNAGEVLAQGVDLADIAAVEKAANQMLTHFGKIDYVVHSAAITLEKRSFADMPPEDWDRLLAVNLSGAWHVSRITLSIMRKQHAGSIVHIASMAGKQAYTLAGPAYTAAKHGLVGLTHSINHEETQHGIRCCAICPGEVNTPILDRRPIPVPQAAREQMIQPEDVASAAFFACAMPERTCVPEILLWPTKS